jgi:PPOX class probable F420-dependent enzyme
MHLDTSSPKGAYAAERLRTEPVIWLTTVRPDGQPQATPVWFVWDEETLLIYSRPEGRKLANIEANPLVSLNLDGDGKGGGIVSIEGAAEVLAEPPPVAEVQPYVDKYRQLIGRLGSDPETFAGSYSSAIRVTPSRFRLY